LVRLALPLTVLLGLGTIGVGVATTRITLILTLLGSRLLVGVVLIGYGDASGTNHAAAKVISGVGMVAREKGQGGKLEQNDLHCYL
jgi:hypothetical protein